MIKKMHNRESRQSSSRVELLVTMVTAYRFGQAKYIDKRYHRINYKEVVENEQAVSISLIFIVPIPHSSPCNRLKEGFWQISSCFSIQYSSCNTEKNSLGKIDANDMSNESIGKCFINIMNFFLYLLINIQSSY